MVRDLPQGFDVALNDRSYVVIETREAVARNRDALENADEAATYDARLEILFDHSDMGELFNPLLEDPEVGKKFVVEIVDPRGKHHIARTRDQFDAIVAALGES